ncbi:hypothetical protein TW85_24915 [Marinomonas sp. S3726]|nr:hypothetical protein TW85_24915 [Marinomonas sp. S3726]
MTSIVIHCAATPNGQPFTAEQIDGWHKERGFSRNMTISPALYPLKHIGYHFVIEVDGAITIGRPLTEEGAHAKGYNHNSVGICMIGTDKFNHIQWEALFKLIQRLEENIDDVLTLYGHNELSQKTCPGFDVPTWIKRKFRPLDKHLLDRGFYELDY